MAERLPPNTPARTNPSSPLPSRVSALPQAIAADIVPTVGFNVEEFEKNNISFTIFDMSGQGRYRNLWEHYYKDVGGIIFVVDSTDTIRMCVAKDELEQMLSHSDLGSVPVLFFANKMDRPLAKQPVECVQVLELDKITDKPWHIGAHWHDPAPPAHCAHPNGGIPSQPQWRHSHHPLASRSGQQRADRRGGRGRHQLAE